MKIAVITCYKDPDYIRARTLRAGLQACPNVETIIVKNSKKGFGRYLEILWKIIATKKSARPDVWLLTFRGYEILPFLLLIAGRKPIIFDEFINLTEWVIYEHHILKADSLVARLLSQWYSGLLQKCRIILADTLAHAKYSAKLSKIPLDKYLAVPVSTDEIVFQPQPKMSTEKFQVFYYGSMLPLHGLEIVLKAAEQLKEHKAISFLLVGGGQETVKKIKLAQQAGANIEYRNWIKFEKLPEAIAASRLCLAGPFGNTVQSQLIITGKAYQFLASAAPVVIGMNQASTDFINKKNALVVAQGDADSLAQAISWAYNHPTELQQIAQAGRQLYNEKFSQMVIGKQLQLALDQL